MTAEHDFSEATESYDVSWDTHLRPQEYAVYGWAKHSAVITDDDEQILFRFTSNDDESLGD